MYKRQDLHVTIRDVRVGAALDDVRHDLTVDRQHGAFSVEAATGRRHVRAVQGKGLV